MANGNDWAQRTLGEVTRCAGGSAFPIRHQGKSEGIPFIKVSDMNLPGNESEINFAANFITPELAKRLKVRIWPALTVVFPKVGAALLTNKRRILMESTIFDNNIMGLVAGNELNPYFLLYFMQTIDMNNYVQNGALPSISNEIVKNITVLLPPLTEQARIVELISSLDKKVVAIEKLIMKAIQLRSSLLSDLLSGNHEIPESYDEVMSTA
jgi:type I restriction enzyme S subunit